MLIIVADDGGACYYLFDYEKNFCLIADWSMRSLTTSFFLGRLFFDLNFMLLAFVKYAPGRIFK